MPGCRAIVLLLALALAACGRQNGPAPASPPAPVTAEAARIEAVPVVVSAIGTAVSPAMVEVKSQVAGKIVEVFFREGEEVRTGARLFRIDPRPFRAALAQARANRARDLAQLRNAETEVTRYRELVRRELAARQALDQRVAQAKSLRAAVAADRAAIRAAELNLEYTLITAPIEGRTGIVQADPGTLVSPGGQTLVTIRKIQPMHVEFALPAERLPAVRAQADAGQLRVLASPPGIPGPPLEGRLTAIDNAIDPATGTIALRAGFPNQDRLLWPGLFVNVRLVLAIAPRAVLVPARALQSGQQGELVFVVRSDATVELRQVKTGQRHGEDVVIEKGVRPGERVVTDGQLGLTPGARVEVRVADAAPPSVDGEPVGN
jgi:multidrug efflux system membrane fusion protein